MTYEQPPILMVKGAKAGDNYISNLSRTTSKMIEDFGYVEMQSVGPPSINNMIKAYIKSKNNLFMSDNSLRLICQFAYQKPSIDDKIRTAIRGKFFPVNSKIIMTPKSDCPILLAKGAGAESNYIKSLSNAMIQSLDEYNCSQIQSIGPVAISNIIKSYIKAKGLISEYTNGLSLVSQFSFHKPEINGEVITAIRASIFAIEDKYVI